MPKKKKLTFEEAMNRLENTVEMLESGTLPLQESLSLFEEGIGHIRTCSSYLKGARGKLKELVKSRDGNLIEKSLGITLQSLTEEDAIDE